MTGLPALPIDDVLSEILAAVRAAGAVVLEAPPGAGKTPRVPAALLGEVRGEVWVLEPRRIAARASAARVAAERGEALGQTVGYAMRFDRRAGPDTRLLYVTEALLSRRMVADPGLQGVGAVVLDEFHERSIHTDVALARVRALRRQRPDLVLVVMSATIDGDAVAAWLQCPVVRSAGRLHPVDIEHLARRDERPVDELAAAAVRANVDRGDLLVFLPGVGEIERCAARLVGLDADVLPLHGEVEASAQDRALRPGRRRRVVLATNVAETSITVDGVVGVIDAGVARQAGFDPWSGLGTLELVPISRASAAQRAGRAGRTGPGWCLRLYTRGDHDARPADTPPEIRRIDLAGTVLETAGAALEWFEPPPVGAWRQAEALLRRLGALDDHGRTAVGEAMARLPLHPRVARVLVEGAALGVAEEAAALAALLGERRRAEVDDPVARALDPRLPGEAERERRALARLLGATGRVPRPARVGDALARALLAGFPDRVGRRRGGTVVFAEGGSGQLDPATPGGDGYGVVSGAEQVGRQTRVRRFTPVPEDWLLDGAEVATTVRWVTDHVEVREQLRYGELVLDESPAAGDAGAVADLLAAHALPVAHRVFPDAERAEALILRLDWLRRVGEPVPAADLAALVRAACDGARSFADLGRRSLVDAAFAGPLAGLAGSLDRLAPDAIPLGNRRRTPVTYPPDQAPYLASRMQDFFGLADGPRLAGGRPLVLHLLAPSGRPVQVTSDLAGFWQRHYPAIRKELMRRYPRHYWPEDPLTAEPPPPRPPRR